MSTTTPFQASKLTTGEIIELLAILQPHGPLQPLLFQELQRRRGGPILPSFTQTSQPIIIPQGVIKN
jgi:hypothetical protein